jgi:hypothetical protein
MNMSIEEYKKFMFNPENSCNCSQCPENQGYDDWQDRHPCGQWNCWVDAHCREEVE